jgi:pilus assembly protein Flp/PilA
MLFLKKWLEDTYDDIRGATSTEYAIIVALIAVVIIGALVILGAAVVRLFEFEFPLPP